MADMCAFITFVDCSTKFFSSLSILSNCSLLFSYQPDWSALLSSASNTTKALSGGHTPLLLLCLFLCLSSTSSLPDRVSSSFLKMLRVVLTFANLRNKSCLLIFQARLGFGPFFFYVSWGKCVMIFWCHF